MKLGCPEFVLPSEHQPLLHHSGRAGDGLWWEGLDTTRKSDQVSEWCLQKTREVPLEATELTKPCPVPPTLTSYHRPRTTGTHCLGLSYLLLVWRGLQQERFTCPSRNRVPVLDTRARDQLVTWPLISTRQSALRWATIYSLFAYFRLNGIKRGFKTREQSREYLQADFARQRARNVQLLKHTLEIVLGTKPFARLDNFPLKQRFKEKQVTFIIFTQVRSGCLSQGCTYVPPWVFSPLHSHAPVVQTWRSFIWWAGLGTFNKCYWPHGSNFLNKMELHTSISQCNCKCLWPVVRTHLHQVTTTHYLNY